MRQKRNPRDPETMKIIQAMSDTGQLDPQKISESLSQQLNHLNQRMIHYYISTPFGACPHSTDEKLE